MASQSGWVDGQHFSSTTVKCRGLGLSRFFISETYGVWVLLSFWAAVSSAAGGGALLLHNLETHLPQRLHAICGASLRAPCLQHASHTRDVCGLAEHWPLGHDVCQILVPYRPAQPISEALDRVAVGEARWDAP